MVHVILQISVVFSYALEHALWFSSFVIIHCYLQIRRRFDNQAPCAFVMYFGFVWLDDPAGFGICACYFVMLGSATMSCLCPVSSAQDLLSLFIFKWNCCSWHVTASFGPELHILMGHCWNRNALRFSFVFEHECCVAWLACLSCCWFIGRVEQSLCFLSFRAARQAPTKNK